MYSFERLSNPLAYGKDTKRHKKVGFFFSSEVVLI